MLVLPGQLFAYYICSEEIRRIRKYAEARLGAAFELRQFHDIVLRTGAVPLSALGERIEHWVAMGR